MPKKIALETIFFCTRVKRDNRTNNPMMESALPRVEIIKERGLKSHVDAINVEDDWVNPR